MEMNESTDCGVSQYTHLVKVDRIQVEIIVEGSVWMVVSDQPESSIKHPEIKIWKPISIQTKIL